ncbi:MAG: hypothetical protein B7733_02640 [Myxococcales bacterium FL481]|nr:MAG: hypothetical protein B7733_02640 [Myxococcales bacterium FL481]
MTAVHEEPAAWSAIARAYDQTTRAQLTPFSQVALDWVGLEGDAAGRTNFTARVGDGQPFTRACSMFGVMISPDEILEHLRRSLAGVEAMEMPALLGRSIKPS